MNTPAMTTSELNAPALVAGQGELARVLGTLRGAFIAVVVFSMVANVLMLAPTLYMLQVYDRVLASRSELTLVLVTVVTLFLFGVMAFAEWARSRLLVRVGVRLDGLLGARVFDAGFRASLVAPDGRPARAQTDLTELRQFLTGPGLLAFMDAPWAPVYIAVLFFLHPLLGLLALVFCVLQAALAWFGHQRALAPARALAQARTDAQGFLLGKLRNAEVVESMGMFAPLRQRWLQRQQAAQAQQGTSQGLAHRIAAWSRFMRQAQQSLGLGAGALLAIDGQITPGAMIAASVLMTRALAPIDLLVNTWPTLINARAAYDRIAALLGAHPPQAAPRAGAGHGRIELRGVGATAPGRATPILQGISLDLAPGSLTVVLGPSGSGKSTLARVVLGIWPQVQGTVLQDGRAPDGWDREDVGYLPQDIELFDGTLAENIGRFTAQNPARVIAAAQAASLHDMILRFPQGYDTPIGEAGQLLSGGQRQRVGLARALYGEPHLVVLDEPNANLDEQGEAALAQALRALRERGAAVMVITHRPGLVNLADQLLVLREGRVHLLGPRDEVLAQLRAAPPARPAAIAGTPPPITPVSTAS